jgi:hypothetical protein
MFLATAAQADRVFIEWTSDTEGSGGEITATVTSTVVSGSIGPDKGTATDPSFVVDFGADFSVLRYGAEASSPGNIISTLSFSPALPEGTFLVIIDVDYRDETVTLTSGEGPLELVEQRETIDGVVSAFPIWDPFAGTLTENTPGPDDPNELEASVFNAGGFSVIDIDFAGGLHSSGIHVVIALPGPVPTRSATWAGVKSAFVEP